MSVTVRRLLPDDAEILVELRKESLLDAPHAFLASPDADRGSDVDQVRQRLGGLPETASFGAFEGEQLVASVGLMEERHQKARHKIWVIGMYVTRAARGRGVGQSLLSELLEFASRIEGIEQICLSVSAESPGAQRLYERLGFRAWGREPRALKVNGEYLDEVFMTKMLERSS